MNKPKSLRDALSLAVPELKKNPDRMLVFVDNGQIAATQANNFSFVYHYVLSVIIVGYSQHSDTIFIPLLVWIRENQPDLLDGIPSENFSFEAEIIDHESTDIEIKLKLTETVVVTLESGKLVSRHLPEPPLLDVTGVIGWQLFANGQEIEQTPIEVVDG